jgi:hypothetical protein
MNNIFKIHWIRHAESCSNIELDELNPIHQISDDFYDNELYHEAKEISEIPEMRETSEKSNNSLFSSLFTTVGNKTKDFFVNSSRKSNLLLTQKTSQPPLSYKGINQAILLGINKLDEGFDYIYCSPTIRTIMTAIFSLRTHSYNSERPIKIIIIPYICEQTNPAGIFNLDYQNQPIPIDKIGRIIEYIMSWIINTFFIYWKDIEFDNILNNLAEKYIKNQDIKLLISKLLECNNPTKRCFLNQLIKLITEEESIDLIKFKDLKKLYNFNFNFDLYQNTNTDFNEFYNILNNYDDFENVKSILCFSHGSILKEHFKLTNKIKNTTIIEEYYKKIIITEPEDIEYNEQTCYNICGLPTENKLFGIINKLLHEPENLNLEHIDDKYKKKYLKYKKKYYVNLYGNY